MADERDFELLDDYLANRMDDQDRSAFEQRLQADPNLRHEFTLQQRLVNGIKDMRAAQLKSMLNKVPVPSGGLGNTVASKVAIGTVLSILIATGAYWYFHRDESIISTAPISPEEQNAVQKPVTPRAGEEVKPETKKSPVESTAVEPDKNQTSAGTEHSKPSQERKPAPLKAPEKKSKEDGSTAKEPALDVFNPTDDGAQNEGNSPKENQQVFVSKNSSLIVETDTENRKYHFHYQFRDGKLFLYGPLEKNLYEILEFFSDEKRTVFLYYKDSYYLLEEKDFKVKPLTPISDPVLLKKLKEYRSTK